MRTHEHGTNPVVDSQTEHLRTPWIDDQDPWAKYQNRWELLNASPEAIRAAAQADYRAGRDRWPEEQITDLNQLLSWLRAFHTFHARNQPAESESVCLLRREG